QDGMRHNANAKGRWLCQRPNEERSDECLERLVMCDFFEKWLDCIQIRGYTVFNGKGTAQADTKGKTT
ncbi:MAG: hypothetical protein KDD28_22620, partial [Phaeodactylibacter sp.]|nr:hypothetical protein [Phaeodactylibacter sp.]